MDRYISLMVAPSNSKSGLGLVQRQQPVGETIAPRLGSLPAIKLSGAWDRTDFICVGGKVHSSVVLFLLLEHCQGHQRTQRTLALTNFFFHVCQLHLTSKRAGEYKALVRLYKPKYALNDWLHVYVLRCIVPKNKGSAESILALGEHIYVP